MTVKCPKCGSQINMTGRKPGSSVECQCGNVVAVPKPGMSRRTLYVLVALGLVGLSCPCIGVMAAIAIPNFIRFQGRAKQAECQANLKAFFVAQRSSSSGEGYVPQLSKVQFSPERGNRYAYFAGLGPMEDRSGPQARGTEEAQSIGVDTFRYPEQHPVTSDMLPPGVANLIGISGECPDCDITMVCAGNLDTDPTLDVWSISTAERTTEDGTTILPGEPFQHENDVMN
ncbi:MAG: fimbrial protein [Myxococcaceae bacterium]|nr:fimbrial protein [Myxococcaceae bacterium]